MPYAIRLTSTERPSYELLMFVLEALGKDALHSLAPHLKRLEKSSSEFDSDGSPPTADQIHTRLVDALMGPPVRSDKMQKALIRVLRQELRSAPPVPPEVVQAFRNFGTKLDLSPVALSVLRFYFVRASFEPMGSYVDRFSVGPDMFNLLATALAVPVSEIRSALQTSSPLMELEILSLRRSAPHCLDLQDAFFLSLTGAGSSDSSNKYFKKSTGRVFPLRSFPIPSHQVQILKDLLKGGAPVQILLAGRQGTGKTELIRSLCRAVKRPAFFVALSPEGIEAQRKVALRVAVNQAKASNAVVVVDEADDFLNVMQYSVFGPSKDRQSKGALNDFMDHTPATIVWLTNRIDAIDRSTLRRFHYSVWFRPFNRAARLAMWHTALKGHALKRYLRPQAIASFAKKYRVDAAGISLALNRTASVLAQRKHVSPEAALTVLREFLSRHLHLISGATASSPDEPSFDPYLLNVVNGTLEAIVERLDSHMAMPLAERRGLLFLFTGPSGVGKSALVQDLADRATLDVIHIRAIDLIRDREEGYVSLAFAEAEASGALVVIDDIEVAFPSAGDRDPALYQAARSEFASSLKQFRGALCATSTAPELIDPLIFCHFDVMCSLGLPDRTHLIGLSNHYLSTLKGETPHSSDVRSLQGMTHADFSMARRRLQLEHGTRLTVEDIFQRPAIWPDPLRTAVL